MHHLLQQPGAQPAGEKAVLQPVDAVGELVALARPASTTRAVIRSGCLAASRYDDGPPPDQHETPNRSTPSESINASSRSACWSGLFIVSVSGVLRNPGRDSAITRKPRGTRKAPITAPRLADRTGATRLRVSSRLALAEALVHALRGLDEEGLAILHDSDEIALASDLFAAVAQARAELGYVDFLRGRYDRAELWLTDARPSAMTATQARLSCSQPRSKPLARPTRARPCSAHCHQVTARERVAPGDAWREHGLVFASTTGIGPLEHLASSLLFSQRLSALRSLDSQRSARRDPAENASHSSPPTHFGFTVRTAPS